MATANPHESILDTAFINDLIQNKRWDDLFTGSIVSLLGFNYTKQTVVDPATTGFLHFDTNNSFYGHSEGVWKQGCKWLPGITGTTQFVFGDGNKDLMLLGPAYDNFRSGAVVYDTHGSYHNQMAFLGSGDFELSRALWSFIPLPPVTLNGVTHVPIFLGNIDGVNIGMSPPFNNATRGLVGTFFPGVFTGIIINVLEYSPKKLQDLYCVGPRLSESFCISQCQAKTINCVVATDQYCTGSALNTDLCKTYCSETGACDARISSYCNTLFIQSGNTINNFLSLTNPEGYYKLCGCHMTDSFPNLYNSFVSYIETETQGGFSGNIVNCEFTPCSQSNVLQATFIKSKQQCPSNVICINKVSISSGGAITGVTVNQKNECSGLNPKKKGASGPSAPSGATAPSGPTPPSNKPKTRAAPLIIAAGAGISLLLIVTMASEANKNKRRFRR